MQSGVIWSTLRDEWDDLLSLFVLSLGIFLWVLRPNNWHDLIHGESAQEFSGRAQEKNAGKAPTNRTPPPRASGRARTWSDPTGGARRAGLASGDDVQAAERRTSRRGDTGKGPPPSRASGRARTWSDPTGGAGRAGLASVENIQAAERRTSSRGDPGKGPPPSLASGRARTWSDPVEDAGGAGATRKSTPLDSDLTERSTLWRQHARAPTDHVRVGVDDAQAAERATKPRPPPRPPPPTRRVGGSVPQEAPRRYSSDPTDAVQAAERRARGASDRPRTWGEAPPPSLASGRARTRSEPAGDASRASATRESTALPPGPEEGPTRGREIESPETKAKTGGQEDLVLLKTVLKSVAEGSRRGQAAPPTPLNMSQPGPRKIQKMPSSGSLFYSRVVNAQVQKFRSEQEQAHRRPAAT
eukprot:Tamp_17348.p1 GENE.Tamp_17348~~Tamp_17348.p1  ORF type:complete len:429 (-),score=35.34 Tamp_17348:111-1355(-)